MTHDLLKSKPSARSHRPKLHERGKRPQSPAENPSQLSGDTEEAKGMETRLANGHENHLRIGAELLSLGGYRSPSLLCSLLQTSFCGIRTAFYSISRSDGSILRSPQQTPALAQNSQLLPPRVHDRGLDTFEPLQEVNIAPPSLSTMLNSAEAYFSDIPSMPCRRVHNCQSSLKALLLRNDPHAVSTCAQLGGAPEQDNLVATHSTCYIFRTSFNLGPMWSVRAHVRAHGNQKRNASYRQQKIKQPALSSS